MDSYNERIEKHNQYLIEQRENELSENAHLIESFKEACSLKGINLGKSNFDYIQTIGIVATYPNILETLCPEFAKDKEGLLDFNSLIKHYQRRPFAKGFLYSDNFMLMAHPYFRRGFYENANFAPRFIDLFWNIKDPSIDTYISLDPNRVRINVDNTAYLELDTWYGAAFSENISTIADGVVKLKPPSGLEEFYSSFLFADAYALDIKWQTKERIKVFYAEEFKTEQVKISKNGNEYFPVRYIHAEFELDKNTFRHFDGAIHFYTEDEYYARRDSDFNYNSKNSQQIKTLSEKLFKMNGIIDTPTWIKFTSQFFAQNPLIVEYCEGKYPENVSDILTAIEKSKSNSIQ